MTSVALATEDELSEALGRRLIAEASPPLHPGLLLRRNGSGYLRTKMRSWCQMASDGQPLLLLTDLDQKHCAPVLIQSWLGKLRRPERLIFRVAVREAEAWLLADHEAMRQLFGTSMRMPPNPDALPNPKEKLLELAQRATRAVRDDLLAERGAIARQGVGYNARLQMVVERHWSPERAATRSESLRRARTRIDELAQSCRGET